MLQSGRRRITLSKRARFERPALLLNRYGARAKRETGDDLSKTAMGGSDARSERYDEALKDGARGARTNETLRTMKNTALHSSFGHARSFAPRSLLVTDEHETSAAEMEK